MTSFTISIPLGSGRSTTEASLQVGEAELVERAKRDPDAMAQLYREHYPAIARYVERRVTSRSDADDVTAEVFLTMVRCLPRYRHIGAPFGAWLYRLATDHIGRWARRRRQQLVQQLEDYAGKEATDVTDMAEVLRFALATLPDKYQSVLSLHYLEELPISDVARIVGCAEGTVKSRLARGRELLRAKLRQIRSDDDDKR